MRGPSRRGGPRELFGPSSLRLSEALQRRRSHAITSSSGQHTAGRISHVGDSFRLAATLRSDRLASLVRQRLRIVGAQGVPADDHHHRPTLVTTPERIAPRDAVHDLLRRDPRPISDLPTSRRHETANTTRSWLLRASRVSLGSNSALKRGSLPTGPSWPWRGPVLGWRGRSGERTSERYRRRPASRCRWSASGRGPPSRCTR